MPHTLRQRLIAPGSPWLVAVVLALFVGAGLLRFWHETGEDLSSSYVGCRLVSTGHTGVLYSYDAENFANVGDLTGNWERLGRAAGLNGYLHPYVQTPLWAFALQPLCDHMQFSAFKHVFLVLVMLSLAGAVWLVGRHWTPFVFSPLAVLLIALGLWFSQPFVYAMFLMQTHALFFFLTILGLVLAQSPKSREGLQNGHKAGETWLRASLAGLAVACAAAVKLTPIVLVVYWLLTRRWRAALSAVIWSAVLAAITVAAVGPHLFGDYLQSLHRVSRILLVAQNNQSFAATVMARFYGPDEVFDINSLPLPTAVRLGSTLLMLGCTVVGGLLDRRRESPGSTFSGAVPLPVGAMMTLVALTIFAPIAWTHYFIILVAPVMVLLQAMRNLRAWSLLCLIVPLIVLNYHPLATDVLTMDIGDYAVVRGQFYAGVLALVALTLAGLQLRKRTTSG